MKAWNSTCRRDAGRVLVLTALMAGVTAPGYGQDRSDSTVRVQASASGARWVATGNLNTARSGHTATLLSNGKVLVVGGYNGSTLDSAELYDPATGEWSVTGRLTAAKSGHTATLLPDGHVLVVGQTDNASDSAELYDPSTGTWSLTGSVTGGWRDHAATLLQSGKVLVVGGWADPYGSYSSSALYDPATAMWSGTGTLITGRGALHQATLLKDGRVLVTGGSSDADFAFGLRNAELYDPVTGTWSRVADLNVPRFGHSATLLPDGRVLVAGGDSLQGSAETWALQGRMPFPANNTAELFDPVTRNWTSTRTLNAGRSEHTASLLPNGEVLVAGGYTYTPPGPGGLIKSVERYDSSNALWRNAADLSTTRYGHTATQLPNGKVLVAGGSSGDGFLRSAELFDLNVPPGTIGPGMSGAWYDPSQSGHGIFVQVLDGNRFLAWWFAFDPTGTQRAWFGGVGSYSGNSATINDVYQTTGGRWIPNFDSSRIANNRWGTLTFTFSDCNHSRVDFSSVSGYGSGSMSLTRLTQPAGLVCP